MGPGGRRTRKPRKPKKPNTAKLIKRYTGIVLKKPHETFPLQKLARLYRKRDGNLDKLIKDFERRAANANKEQFNARLALAGILVHAGRKKAAAKILEAAIADKPKSAIPHLMLARLADTQQNQAKAKRHYEAALPHVKKGIDKERVTRSLMLLSLDLKQFADAAKFHKLLVKSADGSLFVKKELGTEMFFRAHYALAEKEFRRVCKGATGDNRALAPCLRDLGKALAKQKKMPEALKVLKRARRIAGAQAGIRREILTVLTDVYREQGKLVELIAILEAEKGRDFNRIATIGRLYEETGQVDKALETYRSALKLNTKNIDVRVRLVQLLQTAGQLDAAITEGIALIKAAPSSPAFVFQLAETYIQRGERDKALKLVEKLERRSQTDSDVLASVADFYDRIEEEKRSVKVLERLAKLSTGDPQHLADLGDRYFQQGEKKKARATWARILSVVSNPALAQATIGEVYLDHDMPEEALKAFRKAVKLDGKQKRYLKLLAGALERTASSSRSRHHGYNEALGIWEKLLAQAEDNALLARECRTHIVTLWSITRQLARKVAPLRAKLNAKPPDLQAGRLLAEVQRRLQKPKDSEKTLRLLVKFAPGDESSLLALERLLVTQRKLTDAIAVLAKLVAVSPKRARQYYQRMAQYSAELYRDDDAIKYAGMALELSPNDATGHYRLGKMYRRRGDTKRAMQELRNAIAKNDKMFKAYFDLAELLMSAGKVEPADQLYRRVIRTSRDEEYVMQASRLSMQINLGRGTLASLERELLPVALGNPTKSVYRRLLVELYGAMTFPLVHAARLGKTQAAKKARAKLAAIGARAVKPLLDALSDSDISQQRIAIEVLAYVQNKGAGPALFNFATGVAERDLRVRAMVACGALNDPQLLPRYEKLLSPEAGGLAPGDAIAVAATWGLARMHSPRAEPLLARLLSASSPELRAIAALGLGLSKNGTHAPALAKLARSPEAGPTARAAAAHALGELGHKPTRPLLLALTDSPEQQVRSAAILALANLHQAAGPQGGQQTIPADVGSIFARALLGDQPALRRTAIAAATAYATGSYRRESDALPVPNGAVALATVLRDLAPSGYSSDEQASALVQLEEPLKKAALAAVATSPARARIVSQITLNHLLPLIVASTGNVTGGLAETSKQRLRKTAEAIAEVSIAGFVALSRHPSLDVRKRAVEFLAHRDEPAARKALMAALDPADAAVCKAALSALAATQGPEVTSSVIRLLETGQPWSIRSHAASALGRIGLTGKQRKLAESGLEKAVMTDAFALVREAALEAVAARGGDFAGRLLAHVAKTSTDARLRRRAAELVK